VMVVSVLLAAGLTRSMQFTALARFIATRRPNNILGRPLYCAE
jgi:hypothetical protein